MDRQFTLSSFTAASGMASKFNTKQILEERAEEEFFGRRTRIVCTIGPVTWPVEEMVKLINAGMTVARLNFSHGDFETHNRNVTRLNEAMKITGRQVGIMLDTKGPEIRSGFFKAECNGKIQLTAGNTIRLTTDYDVLGDETIVACTYPNLAQSVVPGNKILMADGTVVLTVKTVGDNWVDCICTNTTKLGERKNMNLPGVKVDLPVCGPKEKADIAEFASKVDFVAASFVQSAEDVRDLRRACGEEGKRVQIISKIENQEGIINFDEILNESDCIMVARGDMGMEIPPEKVFLAQKMLIAKCNMAGKPVITATQMLESMIDNPRPTRAEASDVSNAVLDGTDCVMLSGESANGKFPDEAVRVLSRCCLEAESALDYPTLFKALHAGSKGTRSVPEAVCASAVEASLDIHAKLIICLTETGSTARFVAKYRPQARILAITSDKYTVAHMRAMRGVETVMHSDMNKVSQDESFLFALNEAKSLGYINAGDAVVCVSGTCQNMPGATNNVKVITCPQ